jgi:2'-5' RNA ligase
MDLLRLFVALPLPDDLRSAVIALQTRLSSRLSSNALKWVKKDQLHLTLAFLGNVEAERDDALKASLAQACSAHAAMNLSLEGAGCFPHARRPNVLWVGLSGETGALSSLAASVRSATESFSERPDKKAFNPHLTIARLKEAPPRELARVGASMQTLQLEPLGQWRADHVELMRSELLREGARHTVLQRVELK